MVFLCPSNELVLTCASNTIYMQWRIIDAQGTVGTRRVANELISHPSLTVGTTVFHFSLNSPPMSLPHTSQLQAVNVTNGTVISCSNNQEAQSTTICIIGRGCGKSL